MDLVFDRGTLLLSLPPASGHLDLRPSLCWDPRVHAWRAPAFRHLPVLGSLKRRGLEVRDRVLDPLPAPAPVDRPALRPYQQAALEAWELGRRRGLVVLPTGAGKTRVAIGAIARCGRSTLCLVPTRVLLHQWVEGLRAAGFRRVGRLGDGHHEVEPVTVATFESGWRQMPRLGNRFELLVVDEAHHFGGARTEALEMAVAPFRLGLTATPPEGEAASRLTELIGPTVYRLGVQDLAGSPYLADFDHITLQLDLEPEERAAYDARMARFRALGRRFAEIAPGGSWADLVRYAGRTEGGKEALAAFRQARQMLALPRAKLRALERLLALHRDRRHLVFTSDNRAAIEISRRFLLHPVTCHIAKVERDRVLDAFREGRIQGLVSARVLNEGLDVPDAAVALITGGSHGRREHVQRVGRILRPSEGKRALVYELVMRGTAEVRQAKERGRGLRGGEHAS